MTNDKSGVWEIEENSGANALADENPRERLPYSIDGTPAWIVFRMSDEEKGRRHDGKK